MTYYHSRVYIGNRDYSSVGVRAPLPRVYGLQPNSKIAIKVDLYYMSGDIHYPVSDYAVQLYQVTDAPDTAAKYPYNSSIKTEYYYSLYGGTATENCGIILIENTSDSFISDIVYDLQVSRNVYGTIYPSDTSCEIKTVAAVVISDTTKTMSVSDTGTLTATIIKDSDNSTAQTVVWSSDNPSVVSVDQSGNITAQSAGEATITAMVHYKIPYPYQADYVMTDVYATCKVAVS